MLVNNAVPKSNQATWYDYHALPDEIIADGFAELSIVNTIRLGSQGQRLPSFPVSELCRK